MNFLKFKLFFTLSLAFKIFLKWGWVMGLFHFFYVTLNLSEKLPLSVEKKILFFYPTILFYFVSLFLIKAIKALSHFEVLLENTFDLDFQLINLKNASRKKHLKPLYDNEVNRLLTSFSPKVFFTKNTLRDSKATFIVLGLVFLFHLSFLDSHNRFVNNVKSILLFPSTDIFLSYPKAIKENETFSFSFSGNFQKGILFLNSGEKIIKKSLDKNEVFAISNVTSKINGKITFRKGRFYKTEAVNVNLLQKPVINSVVFKIKNPFEDKPTYYEGILRVDVYQQSQGKLTLSIQKNQVIKQVWLNKRLLSNQEIKINKNKLYFYFKTPVAPKWELRLLNQHDLISDPFSLKLTTIFNKSPEVFILSPTNNLIVTNYKVSISYLARDNIFLKKVTLYLQNPETYKEFSIKNQKVIFLNQTKKPIYQIEKKVILPLDAYFKSETDILNYYLVAEDFYGLKSASKTNTLKQKNILDTLVENKQHQENIKAELTQTLNKLKDLSQDYQALKILKEQGLLKKESIHHYQKKAEEIKDALKTVSKKLSDFLDQDNKKDTKLFSKTIRDKIAFIKKEIDQINKDFLEQFLKKMKKNLFEKNFSAKDFENYSNQLNPKEFEKRLDTLLNAIKQLKKKSQAEALSKLAEDIYDHFEDLRFFDLSPPGIRKEVLKKELNSITIKLIKLQNDFEAFDKEYQIKNADSLEVVLKVRSFFKSDFKTKILNLNALANNKKAGIISENLNDLRKRFAFFLREQTNLEYDKAFKQIEEQFQGFLIKISWIERLYKEEIVDLENINKPYRDSLVTAFISDYKTLTLFYKNKIYQNLSGYVGGILKLVKKYDYLINRLEIFQEKIDPSKQLFNENHHLTISKKFTQIEEISKIITADLLTLKQILSKKKQLEERMQSLNQAAHLQKKQGQKISRLKKKGLGNSQNLTDAQKQYLKRLALEQAYIKSLLKKYQNLPLSKKNSPSSQNKQRLQKKSSSSLKQRQHAISKAIALMKTLEEEIKKKEEKIDFDRLKNLNEKIEFNLKKGNLGLISKNKIINKKERKAEKEQALYQGQQKLISKKDLFYKKKILTKKKAKLIPARYRERIDFFIKNLDEN